MKKQVNKGISTYLFLDYSAAFISWLCFFIFRKIVVEKNIFSVNILLQDSKLFLGLLIVPFSWVMYYYLTNTYTSILKKSRLSEILKTFMQTLIGGILLFFCLMLNDSIKEYTDYYYLFFGFLILHFVITCSFRFFCLMDIKNQISNGKLYIPTLLIGDKDLCNKIETEINASAIKLPYQIEEKIIFSEDVILLDKLKYNNSIEAVILAIHSENNSLLKQAIFYFLNKEITVQILPNDVDILSRKIKTQSILGSIFMEISLQIIDPWQRITKRIVDLLISFIGLLFLSPFLFFIALKVKQSSKGNIFFLQERIGINGKKFKIIKFRSMYSDAENGIPQLSSENDIRITPYGKFIRKYRIDELPQLWNVLKGEMSLVGPRPERQFFIDKIIETAPEYQLLQRIKPGITSLGMVKFGYASNVGEMLHRMQYDLLYIENISLLMDVKILIYTVIILWKGKGK